MAEPKKFSAEGVLLIAILAPAVVIGATALVLHITNVSFAWLAVLPVLALPIGLFAAKRQSQKADKGSTLPNSDPNP